MVKNVCVIIQARMNSERLSGKVMRKIGGVPVVGILLDRLKQTRLPIVLATSTNEENDPLAEYVSSRGVAVYRGSEDNVLERYYIVARDAKADVVVRLTGDNPLIDRELLCNCVKEYIEREDGRAYISTGLSKTYPLGMSIEVFGFELLSEAYRNAKHSSEYEHVTPYMHQNIPGDIHIVKPDMGISKYHYRMTIDTVEDFEFARVLIEDYRCNELCLDEIIKVIDAHPELISINKGSLQKNWDD